MHVDHSPDRSILELSTSQHPRALAVLPQHPADPVRLHHLKLHLHRGLLRGETHVGGVRPEIVPFLVAEVFCVACCHAISSSFYRSKQKQNYILNDSEKEFCGSVMFFGDQN